MWALDQLSRRRGAAQSTIQKSSVKLEIDARRVEKVYSGKAGRCACGCCGRFWYPSQRTFKAALARALRAAQAPGALLTLDLPYFCKVTIGERDLTIHFARPSARP